MALPTAAVSATAPPAADAAPGESDLTERIMEYQRREFALLSRSAQRDREMRQLREQAAEAARGFDDTRKDSLRGADVDPTVNLEIAMLRQRLKEKDQEIAKLREEVGGAQFQPASMPGKKLLSKCAHLLEENAELGRQLGEERGQLLRIQMTAERRRRLQLQQRLAEFDRYGEQVDAENEHMQKKIAELGQTLKEVRGEITRNKNDIEVFRSAKKRKDPEKKAERVAAREARRAAVAQQQLAARTGASNAASGDEESSGADAPLPAHMFIEPRKKHRKER